MRIALASLLLATAVGLGSVAYAADPPKPTPPAGAAAGPAQMTHGAMDHGSMDHGSKGHGSKGHGSMGHGMMGHGGMGHGGMEMGAMQCMTLSEARLATVKAELKITPAQAPQWDAFADAMKSNATAMRQGMGMGAMHGAEHDHDGHDHAGQAGSGMMMGGPLPERLERHEAMLTAHLDALHKVRATVSPLYDALTPDQKAKADRLLCGHMGRHGPGAAKGQHAHPHHSQ